MDAGVASLLLNAQPFRLGATNPESKFPTPNVDVADDKMGLLADYFTLLFIGHDDDDDRLC